MVRGDAAAAFGFTAAVAAGEARDEDEGGEGSSTIGRAPLRAQWAGIVLVNVLVLRSAEEYHECRQLHHGGLTIPAIHQPKNIDRENRDCRKKRNMQS